jgi:polypeptide N-acetylgalactosaminyltransferase
MGIMVVDRKFLGEIGALDGGMKVYGGENVELGVRVRSNNIMHHFF